MLLFVKFVISSKKIQYSKGVSKEVSLAIERLQNNDPILRELVELYDTKIGHGIAECLTNAIMINQSSKCKRN